MKWYHITDTWEHEEMFIVPRTLGRKDCPFDDMTPCTCVCPSIAQCLVAIGLWQDYDELRVYVSEGDAKPADWVFDYIITEEARFYTPVKFKKVCDIEPDFLRKTVPQNLVYTKKNHMMFFKNAENIVNKMRVLGY